MAERQRLMQLAVLGMPVATSLSPAIHRQFAEQCGIDIEYRAIECKPGEFDQLTCELALSGGRGCNITVPLKQLAWEQAQRCSARADRAQAVNTLIFEKTDYWYGDNTDGRGLVRDLTRVFSSSLSNSRILIMGAGGASAGIVGDLLDQNPKEIIIGNRNHQRAESLVKRFESLGKLTSCSLDQLADEINFDLVINATSLGHSGRHPVLHDSLIRQNGLCYDLNYGTAAEPLRTHCIEKGIKFQDGLGMLVEQAAVSFHLWTDKTPDTKPVLQTLRQ
jgi:shikimate dehydrogenase